MNRRLRLRSRALAALAAVIAAVALTACDPHTIAIRFEPEVGDAFESRSVTRTEVSRRLERVTADGEVEPIVDETVVEESTVEAVELVTGVDEGITIDVALTRDGAPGRTYSARLESGADLGTVDLFQGEPSENVGLGDLSSELPADLASPPAGSLEPGQRWTIERLIDGGDLVATGHGRVRSLGVSDGRDVAVIEVSLSIPIRTSVHKPNALVHLDGVQTSESRTTYDLATGTARSDHTTVEGAVDLRLERPDGAGGEPGTGTLTYSIITDTTRTPED